MCDLFMRLNVGVESCLEAMERYKTASGPDQDLEAGITDMLAAYQDVMVLYRSLRTWSELALDEWNMTQQSIQRHGIVSTLSTEVAEVHQDVVNIANSALYSSEPLRQSPIPVFLRRATSTVGESLQHGARTTAAATGNFVQRRRENAANAFQQQVMDRAKRAWHLLATSFFCCFVIPLLCLRHLSPLNSIVANAGLCWAAFWVCCPPRWAQRRGTRMAMVILWPLLLVALPLVLHVFFAFSRPQRPSLSQQHRHPVEGGSPSWHPQHLREVRLSAEET
eukprot:gnl/TRDRNA2_/TRDRNA2_73189_c0_seq1.p1 gnl/TRDRNA2_/TRDRNA2_73189_c0~~gnl/TRDRNA2_/TRDRNA2_73189_c0_seq1.p1  ORF type:complete len:279 (+),score=24.64 gnl/TRDRNA2_/TRDRNA2_73189_c0_seq1:1-837(+)